MSNWKVKCIKPEDHQKDCLWDEFHHEWVYEMGLRWGSFWVGERGCNFDNFDNEERIWRLCSSDDVLIFKTRTGIIFKVVG